jgi:hypothetical protein
MVHAADGAVPVFRQRVEQLPGLHAGQAQGLHLGAGMVQRQDLVDLVRVDLQKQGFSRRSWVGPALYGRRQGHGCFGTQHQGGEKGVRRPLWGRQGDDEVQYLRMVGARLVDSGPEGPAGLHGHGEEARRVRCKPPALRARAPCGHRDRRAGWRDNRRQLRRACRREVTVSGGGLLPRAASHF